jgi:Flp pilus assembly protein TadG
MKANEEGNAVIEFVAFAIVLFLPIASFVAQISTTMEAKSRALAIASDLARAAVLNEAVYSDLTNQAILEFGEFTYSRQDSACCVAVTVEVNGQVEIVRQVR